MESNVDVTDRKEMQNKLEEYAAHLEEIVQERTRQLKDAERLTAIGETAGMVGHDLRNPLQTITGETYLAKGELAELPDSEAKANLQESINTIAEQIGYMDKIVSDLQDFVRPIKPDKKPVNMGKLLSATIADVKIPGSIDVETRISQNLPEISVDAQLLKRVFINLVTNSVQAMPHGGSLTITTQLAKTADGTGKIFVHVQDTGEGIPDDLKPRIFRPLFTTKSKGQGFGLAVCKRVIEAHGGTITFKSHLGEGTSFTVELPA
jgi:signal transduction histidine kinase